MPPGWERDRRAGRETRLEAVPSSFGPKEFGAPGPIWTATRPVCGLGRSRWIRQCPYDASGAQCCGSPATRKASSQISAGAQICSLWRKFCANNGFRNNGAVLAGVV